MNLRQRQFAVARIDEILERKEDELRKLIESAKDPDEFFARKRLEYFKAGKVKLRANVEEINSGDNVMDVFDFGQWQQPKRRPYNWQTKEVQRAMQAIRKRAGQLKDKIMLGKDVPNVEQLLAKLDNEPVKYEVKDDYGKN